MDGWCEIMVFYAYITNLKTKTSSEAWKRVIYFISFKSNDVINPSCHFKKKKRMRVENGLIPIV